MKDDKCHGHGRQVYADGATYTGQYQNNKREGNGKYTFDNGNEYDGEWNDDVVNGLGNLTLAAINQFVSAEGTWEDKSFKNSIIKYTNGDEYEGLCTGNVGEWKREGRGTMRLCGGIVLDTI